MLWFFIWGRGGGGGGGGEKAFGKAFMIQMFTLSPTNDTNVFWTRENEQEKKKKRAKLVREWLSQLYYTVSKNRIWFACQMSSDIKS